MTFVRRHARNCNSSRRLFCLTSFIGGVVHVFVFNFMDFLCVKRVVDQVATKYRIQLTMSKWQFQRVKKSFFCIKSATTCNTADLVLGLIIFFNIALLLINGFYSMGTSLRHIFSVQLRLVTKNPRRVAIDLCFKAYSIIHQNFQRNEDAKCHTIRSRPWIEPHVWFGGRAHSNLNGIDCNWIEINVLSASHTLRQNST